MVKRFFLIFICAGAVNSFGQSIASLNFRHLYDPQNEIEFPIKLVNANNQLTVYYNLARNGKHPNDNYAVTWLKYDTYTQKEGTAISSPDSTSGSLSFPIPEKSWLLLAKVNNRSTNDTWNYVQVMDPKYPTEGYLTDENGIVFKRYVPINKTYTFRAAQSDKPLHVYLYETDFSVASPPFTEKGVHTDRFMFADSSFQVSAGQKILLKSKGLYLVQSDTASNRGFSFRVVSGAFPKFTRVEEIPDPLIFVSAKTEHDELIAAGNDKSKVDKVILDITGDKDRAKNFMRSYFRRVELANYYFTSFKEGWKSDRGMIYLIFGLPDEVSRTGSNEVWGYKSFKETFTFVKAGSIYDPGNFTLLRSNKFAETWFSTVDLWRKSRF